MSTREFVTEAAKYVPGLTAADVERGPRGIRAQAMNPDGSLEDDFVVTGHGRLVHLRNAPSPGRDVVDGDRRIPRRRSTRTGRA